MTITQEASNSRHSQLADKPTSDPHHDLTEVCHFLKKEKLSGVPNAETLYEASLAAKEMIESGCEDARRSAAQKLTANDVAYGLAEFVLAREFASDSDERESHYRKAIALFKKEIATYAGQDGAGRFVLQPYFLEEDGYVLAVTEFAEFLWKRGKCDEALETLLPALEASEKFHDREFLLATSWLIRKDLDDKAADLLDNVVPTSADWMYIKALLLFRSVGDTPVSRAALALATRQNRQIGRMLVGGDKKPKQEAAIQTHGRNDSLAISIVETPEYKEVGGAGGGIEDEEDAKKESYGRAEEVCEAPASADDKYSNESEDDHCLHSTHNESCSVHISKLKQFVADTQCAWHHTPNSQMWLIKELTGADISNEKSGRKIKQQVLKEPDAREASKLKRCKSDMDTAQVFADRGDLKGARRLFRSVLKELSRIESAEGIVEFLKVAHHLAELNEEMGGGTDEIVTAVNNRVASIKPRFDDAERFYTFVFMNLSQLYNELGQHQHAADLLTQCSQVFARLLESNDPRVGVHDVSFVNYNLGVSLGSLRRYDEAVPLFQRAIELDEQYLGKDHPAISESLDHLARCLHHLGRHDEEDTVRARWHEVDLSDGEDPHKAHGPSCAWYLTDCP